MGTSIVLLPCTASVGSQHICPWLLPLLPPNQPFVQHRMQPGAVRRVSNPALPRGLDSSLCFPCWSPLCPSLLMTAVCSVHHQLPTTGWVALPALGATVGRVAKECRATCNRVRDPSSPLPGRDGPTATGTLWGNMLQHFGWSFMVSAFFMKSFQVSSRDRENERSQGL